MAAFPRALLHHKRNPNTICRTSSASSSGSSTLPSTQPTSIETSPALSPQVPTHSNRQSMHITSGQAQESSNPTNSDTSPANTTPGPATKQTKKKAGKAPKAPKAETALTAQQKLDRHKRAEAIRRNQLASIEEKVQAWIPDHKRIKGNKSHAKTQTFEAAANWLKALKSDNDGLENTYNELLETYGRINEGHLPTQAQLQEQQRRQQQFNPPAPSPYLQPAVGTRQLPTPPVESPNHSQELAFRALPPHHGNVQQGLGNQQPGFPRVQKTNPPPPLTTAQPNAGYESYMSEEALANRMFDNGMQVYNQNAWTLRTTSTTTIRGMR